MLTAMQQRVATPVLASQEVRCLPHCVARPGYIACTSSFKGGRLQKLNRTYGARHRQQHRKLQVVHAGLGDVGKYLSEAAAAVFSPKSDDVPWSGGSFSGKVSHHEGDVPRLRRLYKAVRETREQLAGCMDPNVSCLQSCSQNFI